MGIPVRIKGIDNLDFGDRMELLIQLEKALGVKGGEGEGDHPDPVMRAVEKRFINALDAMDLFDQIDEFMRLGTISKGLKTTGFPYKPDGTPFTTEEMEAVDWLIEKFFRAVKGTARYLAILAFLTGRMLEQAKATGQQLKIDFDAMPKDYLDLRKKFNLTIGEINAIRWGELHIGEAITRTGENTRHKVHDIVLEAKKNRYTGNKLRQRLRDELIDIDNPKGLQRDWRRVAITESNRAANEGHLSAVPVGGYVIGVSLPDACGWCMKNINGKVMRKISAPPPAYDHLDPQSDRYKATALIWETCLWSGKTNYDRGYAKRKRVAGKLIPRMHHELAMPATEDHVNGRCTWTSYYPDIMYVKTNGHAAVRLDRTKKDFDKWHEYFDEQQIAVNAAVKLLDAA